MTYLNRVDKFKLLHENTDPTCYEEYKDHVPYNKLKNGSWRILYPHPIAYMISNRFNDYYNGKKLWREINYMKERLDEIKTSLHEYEKKYWHHMTELVKLIRNQKKLCNEKCADELQKHLDICSSIYNKCSVDFVAFDCKFNDNGRCSHYYEIEDLQEELDNYKCDIHKYEYEIIELESCYERALAIKEDRLEEYYNNLEDLVF